MNRLLAWRGHAYLALPARLYLGTVFLLACWHKLLDPGAFAIDIATYQILPLGLVNPMAIVLPWVELAAALLLILGWRTRAAALLVTAMLGMFTVAIVIAVGKGLDMACGCFASQGAAEDPISWRTILRDAGWLLLALYVLVADRKPLGLDRMLAPRYLEPDPPDDSIRKQS
jgi:putative oxidoreductase